MARNNRVYNVTTVEIVLSFSFAENRLHVRVYDVTETGRFKFLSACCVEAFWQNFWGRFIDYCALLNELIILMSPEDVKKYKKTPLLCTAATTVYRGC